MSQNRKTALIVGASRGLGLGLAQAYVDQGWRVVATERTPSAGLAALAASSAGALTIEPLDVTDTTGIAALRDRLADLPLDLLFVSAGINIDRTQKASEVSTDDFTRVMLTNALAPLRIIEALADRVATSGTIVAMTSGLGSVAANTSGGYEVYRASKAALNTMLRSYAARNANRSIVALHPGWVRTDMGGSSAAIGIEESVAGMVAVTAGRAGQAGCVFRDYAGKTIEW